MTHDSPQAPRARRLAEQFWQAGLVLCVAAFGCVLDAVCSTRGVPTWACFAVLCCVMLCWPAEMAFMFMERSQGRNRIDYPVSSWAPAALLPGRMRTKGCPTQQKLPMRSWRASPHRVPAGCRCQTDDALLLLGPRAVRPQAAALPPLSQPAVVCVRLLCARVQMGGSESLIQALIRGLEKHGGRLLLRSHVDKIHVENGRAAGVVLQPRRNGNGNRQSASSSSGSGGQPEFIRARKGVISNASVWDTQKLLAPGVGPPEWRRQSITTPAVSTWALQQCAACEAALRWSPMMQTCMGVGVLQHQGPCVADMRPSHVL